MRATRAAPRRTGVVLVGLLVVLLLVEASLWAGPAAAGQDGASAWWWLLGPAVGAAGLALLLRDGDRTGAGPSPAAVAAAVGALLVGLLAVHRLVGGPGDQDVALFEYFGSRLVETGGLPEQRAPEYPPLVVLVAGAAALLAGSPPVGADGPAAAADPGFALVLPLLVAPLLLAALLVVARLGRAQDRVAVRPARGGTPAWWYVLAVLLWPTALVHAEIKLDALPAALLVLGLAAAHRRRAGPAGLALGLGAAAKWYPGLAVLVLAAGWTAAGRRRDAVVLVAAAAGAFLAVHLPFLLGGQASTLLEAYAFHAGRPPNGQAAPVLVLDALGLAESGARPWSGAAAAPALSALLTVALLLVLGVLVAAAARRPGRTTALAAAAPVVFLLLNRVWSQQFLLGLLLVAALGLALTAPAARPRPSVVLVLAGVATTANWLVWPVAAEPWRPLQAATLLATAALLVLALRDVVDAGDVGRPGRRRPTHLSAAAARR